MSDQEIVQQRLEKSYVKLLVGSGVGLFLLIFLCWGGCHVFTSYQERHVVRRSLEFLSAGDLRQAALSARRALQLNPQNIDAMRVMAEIAERSLDRNAIDWRRKVVDVKSSTDDLISLAMAALQFKEYGMAHDALARVTGPDKETARYYSSMAHLAEAEQRKKEAEAFATKAVALAPNDPKFQLQLALLRLDSSEPEKRETGRAILRNLRTNEQYRLAATRALIAEGIAHGELASRLRDLAQELHSYPDATFTDRLLYLDILRQIKDAEFVPMLTKVEEEAVANPVDLASLLSWMNRSSLSALALDFSRSRPEAELEKWPVPLALAESYANLADWQGLEQQTQSGNWGSYEFLRRAFLTRAYRGQEKNVQATREWTATQKDAASAPQGLLTLARTTSEWRWDRETEDILWQLAKRPETQSEALHTLYLQYQRTGNTAGLYRTLTRLAEIEPANLSIQNNLAQLGLLLNADTAAAAKIAAKLHQQEPANPAFTTTYAFSLFKNGKLPQAVEALGSIKEADSKDPSVSLYFGVILAAAGETERARPYLEKAAGNAGLLPEEEKILRGAQSKVAIP